jgi:HPt (histidine-containing phosphotransfer) domain-containing protein
MTVELLGVDAYLAQSLRQVTPMDGGEGVSEAIDWTVLEALEEVQAEGEPDLIVELIDLYLTDAPRWVEAMRMVVAGTDSTLLRRAAHTLKGSSGSLGVRRVAETCRMLEQSDFSDSAAGVEELLQLLDREFAVAREVLAAERARRVA